MSEKFDGLFLRVAQEHRGIDEVLDTFFQMDEFTFMQAHTDEENYTDYMNLYTS